MKSDSLRTSKKEELKQTKSNASLENKLNSCLFIKIFDYLRKNKMLDIIKHNKKIQNILNININDYKEYLGLFSPIEIEIIPTINKYGNFINIVNKEYYHIYFNDDKEETKRYYLTKNDNVSKIKIVIDYQVKSFEKLFFDCNCIESLSFKKCYRNNICDISHMFCGCSSLKEINISNLITNKIRDMNALFSGCSSLKELNISNFNTDNVTDMSAMFLGCSSLEKLNLSNFNTDNVNDMSYMFFDCSSLKELNLSNFHINKTTSMNRMFFGCSEELKEKIKAQNTNIIV